MSETPKKSSLSLKTEVSAETWDKVVDHVSRLCGPLFEASDLLADKIRFYRFRSAAAAIKRAKEICEEEGLNIDHVPIKFLVPFFEKASLEDENSPLIQNWARLLANAGNSYNDKYSYFVNILSEMISSDALLLKRIFYRYKAKKGHALDAFLDLYASTAADTDELGRFSMSEAVMHPTRYPVLMSVAPLPWEEDEDVDLDSTLTSLLCLERQNLIKVKITVGKEETSYRDAFVVHAALTPLGFEFVKACESPPDDTNGKSENST